MDEKNICHFRTIPDLRNLIRPSGAAVHIPSTPPFLTAENPRQQWGGGGAGLLVLFYIVFRRAGLALQPRCVVTGLVKKKLS